MSMTHDEREALHALAIARDGFNRAACQAGDPLLTDVAGDVWRWAFKERRDDYPTTTARWTAATMRLHVLLTHRVEQSRE